MGGVLVNLHSIKALLKRYAQHTGSSNIRTYGNCKISLARPELRLFLPGTQQLHEIIIVLHRSMAK